MNALFEYLSVSNIYLWVFSVCELYVQVKLAGIKGKTCELYVQVKLAGIKGKTKEGHQRHAHTFQVARAG